MEVNLILQLITQLLPLLKPKTELEKIKEEIRKLEEEHDKKKQELLAALASGNVDLLNQLLAEILF